MRMRGGQDAVVLPYGVRCLHCPVYTRTVRTVRGTGAPVAGAWSRPAAAGCDIGHVGNFFPHWRLYIKPREPTPVHRCSGNRIGPKADTGAGHLIGPCGPMPD